MCPSKLNLVPPLRLLMSLLENITDLLVFLSFLCRMNGLFHSMHLEHPGLEQNRGCYTLALWRHQILRVPSSRKRFRNLEIYSLR